MTADNSTEDDSSSREFRQILGIRFFLGDARRAIAEIKGGGLLVVPAAPALKDLPRDREYREALLHADLAITDSGMMVLVWNLLQRDHIRRLSGLAYFKELAVEPEVCAPGGSFWIMAGEASAAKNLNWLHKQGVPVSASDIYIAPFYGPVVVDEMLLERLRERPAKHVIITIGGGSQEKLGLYLKRNLGYRPSIHCVGAAIAFLSGDQVYIPQWADRLMLGWVFRCISAPRRYMPRYWGARRLFGLMRKYRERLPLEG